MAVDVLGEPEPAGWGKQGGGGSELAHAGLGGLDGGEDLGGDAEVSLGDDLGLAVDAPADAGIEVGSAADDLLHDAGYQIRSYNSSSERRQFKIMEAKNGRSACRTPER